MVPEKIIYRSRIAINIARSLSDDAEKSMNNLLSLTDRIVDTYYPFQVFKVSETVAPVNLRPVRDRAISMAIRDL